MYDVKSRQVDWEEEYEDWDTLCPFCEGEGETAVEEFDTSGCYECGAEWDEQTDTCPKCGATGDSVVHYFSERTECCEHCENGYLVTYWNTVWDPEKNYIDEDTAKQIDAETPCLLVFNSTEGRYFLTLGGCGMDLTPGLAKAWLMLGFQWLPLNWVTSMIRSGKDYIGYVAGEEWTPRIVKVMRETLEYGIVSLQRDLDQMEGWEV